jgi:AraC-like DNA-binding protein
MTPRNAGFGPVHLTTEGAAPQRRAELAREVFGRQILRLDVEPVRDQQVRLDLKLWSLPGLKLGMGRTDGAVASRTKTLLSDGDDDVFVTLCRGGQVFAERRGHPVVLESGAIHLASNAEPTVYTHRANRTLALLAPRAVIAALVPDLDDRIGRPMPRNSAGVGLLANYAHSLAKLPSLSEPGVAQAVASHVHDLIALALGARGDGRALAGARGLKAARLAAIKAYIAEHLATADMSVTGVAAVHQLTPRYVQRLFEGDGSSFSSHVLAARLGLAHRLLADPRTAKGTISTIAYACGFGDLSHFNHAFRRRYGYAPSDARAGKCH